MPILLAFFVVILEMIPFNVPTKNRNRVGGVMTPPYEGIPSNYNLARLLSKAEMRILIIPQRLRRRCRWC